MKNDRSDDLIFVAGGFINERVINVARKKHI